MFIDIVSAGRNCGFNLGRITKAIWNQKVPWRWWIVDDASDDGTDYRNIAKSTRCTVLRNSSRKGAAYSRWKAFQAIKNNKAPSIVAVVDLDDSLKSQGLLDIYQTYTKNKQIKATSGSFERTSNGLRDTARILRGYDLRNNNFLKYPAFYCPPLRTFHSSMIDVFNDDTFKINGDWIDAATDVAYFYPILCHLEPHQYAAIRNANYIYSDDLPNSVRATKNGKQNENFDIIRKRLKHAVPK